MSVNQIAEGSEILCTRTGSGEGEIGRPSRGELIEAFGSTNFDVIAKFMLENGKWRSYGYHDVIRNPSELSRAK